MKKISVIIILMSVLFFGTINVQADGKIYGIYTCVNNIKESKNIYEENEEYQAANGKIKVKGSNVTFNNLSDTDFISLDNYSGDLGMTLAITLSGNSTIKAFRWYGFSGKLNISGTGSLKFKPVSTIGTKEVPGLDMGGIPFYYVEGIENQKSEVSKIIQTSLPITYVDGYVCINCKVESPKEEPSTNTETPKKENPQAPVTPTGTPKPTKTPTPTKPATSNNETKPNPEKKFVKKLMSKEGIEFTSKDDIDSTYKLVTKDITSNYSDIKLEKNLELIQVYDITVQSNDNKIVEMKNGEYLIKLKLTEKMKEYDHISIAYLKNGAIKETFDISKDNEHITFTTTHLSEYGVLGKRVEKQEESNKEEKQEESNVVEESKKDTKEQNSNLGFIIGGMVLTILLIAAILFGYSKKKAK